jgi:hypothetical protein
VEAASSTIRHNRVIAPPASTPSDWRPKIWVRAFCVISIRPDSDNQMSKALKALLPSQPRRLVGGSPARSVHEVTHRYHFVDGQGGKRITFNAEQDDK